MMNLWQGRQLQKCIDLSNSQFQMLCEKIGYFGEWTQKLVANQKKFRGIE